MKFSLRDSHHKNHESEELQIAAVRDSLQSLFARQQQSPDEEFVQRLERNLALSPVMPVRSRKSSSAGLVGRRLDGTPKRSSRLPSRPKLASLASIVPLLALVAAMAAIVLVDGNSDPDQQARQGTNLEAASPANSEALSANGWELPLHMTDLRQFGGMVLFDGVIYRLVAAPGLSGIQAIDAASGKEIWENSAPWTPQGLAVNADGVYYVFGPDSDASSTVHALDLATGAEKWTLPLPATARSMRAEASDLFVVDTSDSVTAIDSALGKQIWQSSTYPDGASEPLDGAAGNKTDIAVGEHFVSLVTAAGTIATLDRDTGATLWTYSETFIDPLNYEFSLWNPDSDSVTGYDQTPSSILFVVTLDRSMRATPEQGAGMLAAIDTSTGDVLWNRAVSTQTRLDVAVSGNTVAFAATGFLDTGRLPATPAAATAGIRALTVGSPVPSTSLLYGLDVQTGELMWSIKAPTSFFIRVGALDSGAFLGALNNDQIVIVNTDNGMLSCVMKEGLNDRSSDLPIATEDQLIFIKMDGTLVAVPLGVGC